jgi:hypothetical protein
MIENSVARQKLTTTIKTMGSTRNISKTAAKGDTINRLDTAKLLRSFFIGHS